MITMRSLFVVTTDATNLKSVGTRLAMGVDPLHSPKEFIPSKAKTET